MIVMRARWTLAAGLLVGTASPAWTQMPGRPHILPPSEVGPPVSAPVGPGGPMGQGGPGPEEAAGASYGDPSVKAALCYRPTCVLPPGIVGLGHFVRAHGEAQVANREAARMVLYQYDFVEGTALLNVRGHQQLAKMAALLPRNFNCIIIEPCGPAIDQARRTAVLNELASGPFPVPSERVVVAVPTMIGLNGVDAVAIARDQLIRLQTLTSVIVSRSGTTSIASGTTTSGGTAAAPPGLPSGQ